MDLIGTYPRRLFVFVLLSALLLYGLRAPIAYLNEWRAEQEVMANNRPGALSQYERATLLQPDDTRFLIDAGYLYAKQGRRDAAISAYRRAASVDPTNTEALFFLALELESTGDFAGGVDVLKKAVRLHPGEERTLRLLATLTRRSGDVTSSKAAWRAIARHFPDRSAEASANIRTLEVGKR